ncbi:hypothetical protein B0H13DRAFT_1876053 [Mycena leptocephala]|nr:hypothetical protein B0H13DRAFT_1876053 [Mycena leptocephala]
MCWVDGTEAREFCSSFTTISPPPAPSIAFLSLQQRIYILFMALGQLERSADTIAAHKQDMWSRVMLLTDRKNSAVNGKYLDSRSDGTIASGWKFHRAGGQHRYKCGGPWGSFQAAEYFEIPNALFPGAIGITTGVSRLLDP